VEELQLTLKTQHSISFLCLGSEMEASLDEKLLRQLITNLLSNAIKYSPEGGNIQFHLIYENESVTFRIQDRGIGIPIKDQAQLFDAFYRSSNVGTIAGTGLGLAIVKRCVDFHKGHIALESEVGVGTTFTVTLPLKPHQPVQK
jgi:signal transduction histidine kinase